MTELQDIAIGILYQTSRKLSFIQRGFIMLFFNSWIKSFSKFVNLFMTYKANSLQFLKLTQHSNQKLFSIEVRCLVYTI